MKKFLLIILLLKLLPCYVVGQQFYRVQADFSIKEKQVNGASTLVMGTVYYDKAVKKVVYDIKFPKKAVWVIENNVLYNIAENKLISKQPTIISAEESIFHLALTGRLADYGLKNSMFKIDHVEKEDNMVISIWLPDLANRKKLGKVVMSHINKKLNGIVFYNSANEVLTKQFFKNYSNVQGCEFPGEIDQTSFIKTGKNFQVTTYKKININATDHMEMYNYTIPK